MDRQLDFDKVLSEIQDYLSPEAGYWMERLLHTYIGNPVTGLYTQIEIIQRALDRRPEMVPDEVARLKENVKLASDNIVKVVRALAAAFSEPDDEQG